MKTVLITGASSGIGRQFARAYGKRNYNLILCGRRKERLEELAEEFANCRIIVSNLSDEQQCYDLLRQLEKDEIDVFINNAGFGLAGSFLETDVKREVEMIKVNDIAMHILCKGILQKMNVQGSGTIVNVASSAGLFPGGPYMAGYYASKAYMTSLTRAVAQELEEAGSHVYVCALCPGPVDTEFNRTANVTFALKGSSAEQCVSECLKEMEKRKIIIVPSFRMKAATFFCRFLPTRALVRMTGGQQKKKISG